MAITPSFFKFGTILDIDLSVANTDKSIEVYAAILAVLYCDGSGSLKLDNPEGASFDLTRIGTMNFGKHPIERIYLTNTAQAGKKAQILVTELKDITIQVRPITGQVTLVTAANVQYDAREVRPITGQVTLVTAANVQYDAREAIQDVTEIEDEDIRDTNPHTSDVIAAAAHRSFTFVFGNGCNEIVNVQLQASYDGIAWVSIGDPTSVAAAGSEYQTITEAWHSYRCVSTAAASPASGTLLIEAIRRS